MKGGLSTKMMSGAPMPVIGGGMQGGMIGKQMGGMVRPSMPQQQPQPLPQPIQQQPAPTQTMNKISQPAMASPILNQNAQTIMQNKNNIGRLPVGNSQGGMGGGKSGQNPKSGKGK